jgi:uncharacterized protein (TIGR03435 family)
MRAASSIILLGAFASSALCQQFEVVSVRPNKSISSNSSFNTNGGRLVATNMTLRGLIWRAYGVEDYQLEGPDWLNAERFDVSATFPAGMPNGEKYNAVFQTMMQSMLADRFKLVAHREQKEHPVYALMVGKSGIKFKAAPESDCGSHGRNANGTHFVGTCVSMDAFAAFLAGRRRDLPVDLPVINMTGLMGFYNVKLDWVPESKSPADNPSGVTLTVALDEQLGLKLETRQAPIKMLVVDHAEKAPTEN